MAEGNPLTMRPESEELIIVFKHFAILVSGYESGKDFKLFPLEHSVELIPEN